MSIECQNYEQFDIRQLTFGRLTIKLIECNFDKRINGLALTKFLKRKYKMRKLVLFGVFSLMVSSIRAQSSPFSLKDCIDYAWKNNLDVQQALLSQKSVEIDERQSYTSLLPSLSASAGQHYQFGRTIDRFTNTFINQTLRSNNIGINAGLTVFNGFQNYNNIKQQQTLRKASAENIENTKNQVAINVSSAYLLVIQSVEQVKNAEMQVQTTQQNIIRAQKMVDAGVADLTVLLTQKAQLANEELAVINANAQYNNAILSLKMLMQYPFNDPFELLMPANIQTLMAQTGTADDIYRAAVSKLPQVRAAVLQKEAADIQIRVSKSLWSPTVSLYGSVSTVFSENAKEITGVNINGTQVIGVTQNGNENVVQPIYSFQTRTIDFNKQLRDNIGQSAGISLSWNLFNGFQAQNQIAKSKINSQVSELNLKRVENALMNEINLAYNNYLAANQRYAATSKSVEAQQNNLNYIQKRYEAGATNVFELTQAKNNYSMATSNEIQAKYEVVFRALIIEFYKGNPIAL